jgi:hypothetical protein
MSLSAALFERICDMPGITGEELHKWVAARFALLPRLRCSVALWHLEDDGEIMYVECKCGCRHYYPADTGRATDHRVGGER